jgi:hypothetical protein
MSKYNLPTIKILEKITSTVTATDLELVAAHYTAQGLTAVIKDVYNKQKYKITITPIGEEE